LCQHIAQRYRTEKGASGTPTFTFSIGKSNAAASSGTMSTIGTSGDMGLPRTYLGWIRRADSHWPNMNSGEWLTWGWHLDSGVIDRYIDVYESDGWLLYDQLTYQKGIMELMGTGDLLGTSALQGDGT